MAMWNLPTKKAVPTDPSAAQFANGNVPNTINGWRPANNAPENVHKMFNGNLYNWDSGMGLWILNQGPPAPAAPQTTNLTSPLTGQTQNVDAPTALIRQNTERSMNMLRSTLGTGRMTGEQHLMSSLAGRGMLDSGSMGAGMANIQNAYGSQMAQGVQHASMNENDALLDMLKQKAAEAEAERNRRMQWQIAQYQAAQARDAAQRGSHDSLLGSLISGGGSFLGGLIPALFSKDSKS